MAYSSAYAIAGHAQDGQLFVQQDAFTSADTIYFSLVTLTTVGYGDLTMRTDLTRIMAAMEALLGQIYLITAVGLADRQPRASPPKAGEILRRRGQ